MQVTTIGVDLAKNVFQVHGITASEEVVFNKPLRRAQFLPFFAKLDPCLIGMESCSSAHHWARELTALGHEVRLIPPIEPPRFCRRLLSSYFKLRFCLISRLVRTSPLLRLA